MASRARIVAIALTSLLLPRSAGAEPGLHWQPPIVLAEGGGERGTWRQNDSRYDYVDDATVAFLPGGELGLAWVDQKRKEVFFQKAGWRDFRPVGTPQNVSRNPATFSWQPRIAVAKDAGQVPGAIYSLWQEIIFSGGSHGGDILFARSTDGGAGFSAPLNLSRSRGGDGKGRQSRSVWSNGSHDLAVAVNGDVLAAWTEYDGALWFARSRDGGARFTAPRKIAGNEARPARAPALATGPGGTAVLAWSVGEERAAAIRVVQSGDGGARFGPVQLVGGGQGQADAPRLAVDGKGAVHLVYAETPERPGACSVIRYAHSPRGAGRFGTPRTISGSAAGSAAYPAIGTDRSGRVYVTWEATAPGVSRPGALGIAWSADGGQRFAAPAEVPGSAAPAGSSNGSHQGLLGKKLAVDHSGRIAVVNSSLGAATGSRVWLVRGQCNCGAAAGPARSSRSSASRSAGLTR